MDISELGVLPEPGSLISARLCSRSNLRDYAAFETLMSDVDWGGFIWYASSFVEEDLYGKSCFDVYRILVLRNVGKSRGDRLF